MDHYPYKDKMYIKVSPSDESRLEKMYDVFREEVKRKEQNGGEVIVPSVIITAPGMDLRFKNVKVSAHNLRSDVFQEAVVTAVDVILSLGDEGKLSYDLTWFDSIGTAEIVRTYYVTRINEAKSYLRCGFVYEAGSWEYHGFQGNHIHIPSDIRVINSPEYVEYFWICI